MYIYRSEYAYVVSVYVYILKSSRRLRLTSLSICLCKNGLETGADNLIGYVVKILGTVPDWLRCKNIRHGEQLGTHDSRFCS